MLHNKETENAVSCTPLSIMSFAFTNIMCMHENEQTFSPTFTCFLSFFLFDNFHLLDCEISNHELLEMARVLAVGPGKSLCHIWAC